MKAPKLLVNGELFKIDNIKCHNNYISFVSYFKDGWLTAAYYNKSSNTWYDEDNKKVKVKLFY